MSKTVLFLAAHPDDVEAMMAGTALAHSSAGDACYEAVMTRGEKGAIRKSRRGAQLAGIREKEGLAAGHAMGMREVMFFDFPDGGLKNSVKLRSVIAGLITRIKPDIIYAPEFYRSPYPHPDHLNLGEAVWDARNEMEKKPILRCFHPLDPTQVYSIEPFGEKKSQIIAIHRSQAWINGLILGFAHVLMPQKYFAYRKRAGSKYFEFYREV